jgi:hypothetical protein
MNYIKINGEEYPFRMGLNVFRRFGKTTGMELNQVIDFINAVGQTATQGTIPFNMLDKLAQLIICGVDDGIRKEKSTLKNTLVIDDIIDLFEESPESLENIFKTMGHEMPPAETPEEGNPKAPETIPG